MTIPSTERRQRLQVPKEAECPSFWDFGLLCESVEEWCIADWCLMEGSIDWQECASYLYEYFVVNSLSFGTHCGIAIESESPIEVNSNGTMGFVCVIST